MRNDLKFLKSGISGFETLELSSTAKLLKQMNSLSVRSQFDELNKHQRLMDNMRKSLNPFSDKIGRAHV